MPKGAREEGRTATMISKCDLDRGRRLSRDFIAESRSPSHLPQQNDDAEALRLAREKSVMRENLAAAHEKRKAAAHAKLAEREEYRNAAFQWSSPQCHVDSSSRVPPSAPSTPLAPPHRFPSEYNDQASAPRPPVANLPMPAKGIVPTMIAASAATAVLLGLCYQLT